MPQNSVVEDRPEACGYKTTDQQMLGGNTRLINSKTCDKFRRVSIFGHGIVSGTAKIAANKGNFLMLKEIRSGNEMVDKKAENSTFGNFLKVENQKTRAL
jgi:hypothetical protein